MQPASDQSGKPGDCIKGTLFVGVTTPLVWSYGVLKWSDFLFLMQMPTLCFVLRYLRNGMSYKFVVTSSVKSSLWLPNSNITLANPNLSD